MSTLDEWLQEVQEAMEYKIGKELNDILYKEYCAGIYHVSGYTRDDGTNVSDYWRTCGASNNGMNPNYGNVTGGASMMAISNMIANPWNTPNLLDKSP